MGATSQRNLEEVSRPEGGRASSGPFWPSRSWAFLVSGLLQILDRYFQRLPLSSDRYDRRFFVTLGSVAAFSILALWSLTRYSHVKWFYWEDGVSEWWSAATYLASGVMAAFVARLLIGLGHPRIGLVHVIFAVAFIFLALEEVSWGQRLFGWSTPEALGSVNEQDEITLHNLTSLRDAFYGVMLWAAILALAGSVVRVVLHHHRRVTTADFILPSLVLAPALLMIFIWIHSNNSYPGNLPRMLITYFDLGPVATEVSEVILGLGLVLLLLLLLYTYSNLKRALALRGALHKNLGECREPRFSARESEGCPLRN